MPANTDGATDGPEALGQAGTLARIGPYVVVGCVVLLAFVAMIALQLLDLSLSQAQRQSLAVLGFGLGLSLLGLSLLYQAAFVLRYPEAAIEYDVQPPSKYDLSFETVHGAKRTAALTVVAGLVSLLLGGAGFWMLIALQ